MELNNKTKMRFPLRSFGAAILLTLATCASAAPGTLSDVPLYTRGAAEPNIMFVLDSSGSMQGEIWPPSEYDENISIACANPLPSSYRYQNRWGNWRTGYYTVEFRVRKSDGRVEFRLNDDGKGWRIWDSTNDCFDNGKNYRAWFYAYETSSGYYETGSDPDWGDYRDESASGHLLNWYFSEKNDAGAYVAAKFLNSNGVAARSKVPVTRTDVMKTSAAELVGGLEDVRIGLMQFNGGKGGRALLGLTSIDDKNRSDILNVIAGISADGSTPLGETFEDVGRYFISGYETQKLSYEDSSGTIKSVAGNTIFASEPDWDGVSPAVPKPDNTADGAAIQYYCQKSFMVALTDGQPTSDASVSSILKSFDHSCAGPKGCTSGDDESMDDVVKALYDLDLRPDLKEPDGTPVKHNITSYLIGFANQGLSDSDVMVNAGALGGGGVYSADDAASLKVTFNRIINKVRAAVGTSGSVAFNSTSLEAGSALFAAKFDSGDWSGELAALELDADGKIAATPSWKASSILDSVSDHSQRVMLTYKPGTGGVPFTESGLDISGSDTETEKDLNINTSSGIAETDNRAADRIAYLRGDRTKEGTAVNEFRQRSTRLGDIVNSTPVYVGKPNAKWSSANFPEAKSYEAFKSAKSGRTPVVYVGANDGFLHGFNASLTGADKGKELIAYSPAVLTSTEDEYGLHALSSQNYLHKYYVDGTPTVTDVYINSAWKSVLVGGLGGGGKGYFALDVTDPALFKESNAAKLVLWEFTDADNENLGYTFSRPQMGRMSNGEWVAIFGNGYNSKTGDAGLFIVYLDGDDGLGNNHIYLSTKAGSASDKNGLSTPAIVDADLDGTIDRIYAGDLKGNMWVFDVSTTGKWDVVKDTSAKPKPLFTAAGEPITGAPLVARNTAHSEGADPNLLVTFGTGQYLTDADTASTAAGGFYAVWDNGTYGLSKTDLEVRTIAEKAVEQKDKSTRTRRILGGDELDWSKKHGWYIPLKPGVSPDGGERVITRPDLLRNVLFFNTVIPTGQVCSAGGRGWLMSVDIRTGLAPEKFGVFDGNGDGVIDLGDQGLVGRPIYDGAPNKSGFIGGGLQVTSTTDGSVSSEKIFVGSGAREGRLSWEEITPN